MATLLGAVPLVSDFSAARPEYVMMPGQMVPGRLLHVSKGGTKVQKQPFSRGRPENTDASVPMENCED